MVLLHADGRQARSAIIMRRVLVIRETGTPAGPYAPWRTWLPGLASRTDCEAWLVDAVRPAGLPGLPALRFIHAPLATATVPDSGRESHLADVLARIVPSDDERLAGRLRAWLDLIDVIEPDRLVTDLSPMARLAACIRSIPVIDVGHSWLIPPRLECLPEWHGVQHGDIKADEHAQQKLLDRFNEQLRVRRMPVLSSLAELWGSRCDALVYGWPELDFFPQPDPPRYLGWSGRCSSKSAPEARDSVRVLAVLHGGYRHLRSCLDVVTEPPFKTSISVIGDAESFGSHYANDSTAWHPEAAVPPCPHDFDLVLCQDDPDALMAAIDAGRPAVMIATVPVSAAVARLARHSGNVRLIDSEPCPEALRRALLDAATPSAKRYAANARSSESAARPGSGEQVELIAERIHRE